MIKLFEIPIYAISRNKLNKKYQTFRNNFKSKYPYLSSKTFERCIELETYPQRCWEYNHLIGYILIYYEFNDIYFNVYLPYKIRRYYWRSYRKIYVRDIMANSTHFRIDDITKNKEKQKDLIEMLDVVIKDHIPKEFYVDRETFDNTYSFINYSEIILNSKSLSQSNKGKILR